MTVRTISSTSVHVTGSSRLPMVAGWDDLLPIWFSRLHPRYKTPINSIIFVGAITLVIAIASQIGAGIQEAFQLVDNAANVFYGIVYFTHVRDTDLWRGSRFDLERRSGCVSRPVAVLRFVCSAIFFTVYPIIDVPSPLSFAAKIIAVTVIANAIGVAILRLASKRRAVSALRPQFSATQRR